MSTPATTDAGTALKPNTLAIYFAYATVFLITMGIGVITPVIPEIISPLISDPKSLAFVAGLIHSTYAFCQFLSAPGLGSLSDRFGRRPILLICIIGSSIGYLLFGIGGALSMLFLGRIIDGLTGGNISTLFAYVADMTAPAERGLYFGRLGAAAGLGFIFGPVIGGYTAQFGSNAPLFVATGLTFINFVLGLFIMPETHRPENRAKSVKIRQLNPFSQLRSVIALPNLYWLLMITLFYFTSFSVLQSNIAVFSKDVHGWAPQNISGLFFIIGIISIVVQGVLVKWLLTIWSDTTIALVGLAFLALSLSLIALSAVVHQPNLIYVGIACFAFGDATASPMLAGLLSRVAGPEKQGLVQGSNQSVTALGRIIGPLLGGQLYVTLGAIFPYVLGSVAMLAAIVIVKQQTAQFKLVSSGSAEEAGA